MPDEPPTRHYNDKSAPPFVVPCDPRSREWNYRHDLPSQRRNNFFSDKSIRRISGESGIHTPFVPLNFNRLPPFQPGDIIEIKDKKDNEFGKQGVFDKQVDGLVYFSCNWGGWKRSPEDLQRIHMTEYKPH